MGFASIIRASNRTNKLKRSCAKAINENWQSNNERVFRSFSETEANDPEEILLARCIDMHDRKKSLQISLLNL